tara:strand:+ start:252 stop:494 length:243 start_codon:yes stop_codon:yes gene_type:complete
MLKIRLVPQQYRRMDYLEKDLRKAKDQMQSYLDNCRGGTDPILIKVHETNIKWRQSIIDRRLAHPYSKPANFRKPKQDEA